MTKRVMRRRGFFAFAVLAAISCAPASAQLNKRYSVEVSPRASYSTNPFLQSGKTAAPLLGVGLVASYNLVGETQQTSLVGRADATQYLRRYGLSSGYGASLRHERRLDARTDVRAGLDFDSSVLGEREGLFAPGAFDPNFPSTGGGSSGAPGGGSPLGSGSGSVGGSPAIPALGDVIDPDAALLGGRQRRTSIRADMGATIRPKENDLISFGGDISKSIYSGDNNGSDFVAYGANAAYTRGLSPAAAVGGQLSAQRINYSGNAGSSSIYQPQLLFNMRVNESWSLRTGLGFSFVDRSGSSGQGSTTNWSAFLEGCWRASLSNLCGQFSRDASPSGLGEVRTRSTANLSYSRQLTTLSSASIGANYSRYNGVSALQPGGEFWNTNAAYQRRISERLSLGASAAVRGLSDGGRRETDLSAQISLSYRYGNS